MKEVTKDNIEEILSQYFDEDGDLLDSVYKDVSKNGAEGIRAIAFLCGELASCTHGNYSAQSLFCRQSIDMNVELHHIPRIN